MKKKKKNLNETTVPQAALHIQKLRFTKSF